MSTTAPNRPLIPKKRLFWGTFIFVVAQLGPLAIPLVTSSELSGSWKTTLSSLLLLGIPELGIVIAVAILGKEGFQYIKSKFFQFLRKAMPPDHVSKGRYYLGVGLFFLPIFLGWLNTYINFSPPYYEENRLVINLIGDIITIIGLFIAGGNFWDKIRHLFVWDR